MRRFFFLWFVIVSALALAACGEKAAPAAPPPTQESASAPPALYSAELARQAFQKGGCGACHVIPGVEGAGGTIGPDLTGIAQTAQGHLEKGNYKGKAKSVAEFLAESIRQPDVFVAPDCNGSPCQKGLMPASLSNLYNEEEIQAMVQFLMNPPQEESDKEEKPTQISEAQPAAGNAPALSDEEFAWAKQVYFERCAGCHGTLRKGATGPALTPDKTQPKGTLALAAIIFNGTPRGMPDWGKQGFFTQEQTEIMAKFLQNEPPAPPEMALEQMKASWKVLVPPDQRP
ncbi:c-type cytochrome, partial [Anaerolinea sp.]|uniref:c-type cytochrome n=1 Tax=Anaerolinea sp. TaxID=1872519 RepID=UPI002ACDF6A4